MAIPIRRAFMESIQGIGFDLFNTLITVDQGTLGEANLRVVESLRQSGFDIELETFSKAHRDSALQFLEACRKDGRETHNRFWISSALHTQGHEVSPDDPSVAAAVEAYFSAFYPNCRLIPGTIEMLEGLNNGFRLGLLSNFTHGPAAREILDLMGLTPLFDVILISGELGYRKPHPMVFRRLTRDLGVDKNRILYVGDDPEPDISGALGAGLRPVWTTYVRDRKLPATSGILGRGTDTPDRHIPRISGWQDLFDLLGREWLHSPNP